MFLVLKCNELNILQKSNKQRSKIKLILQLRDNLKNFDSNLLKIDKKHYTGINIYYIRYITIKKIDDCENIQCKSFVFAC